MRTSTLLFSLTLSILAMAQSTVPDRLQKAAFPATRHAERANDRTGDDPLWTEDFENGLGGWVVETHGGEVDWQLTSTGNSGGFTPGPLESTTGYPNGSWIVADSDAEGTDGEGENTTITSAPIVGFDTVPYMLLQFEQSFRQLNDDQTLVEVSGDGGGEWTIFPVNVNIGGNQSTPGAPASETITLNISSALNGGADDIRIRFRWISDQGFTYSWQVDDIALLPVRANDLVISNAVHAVWNEADPDYLDLPYTIYLSSETRELHFRATITNNGSATQTNVRLVVDIDGPGSNNELLSSDQTTLAPGASQVMDITGYSLPSETGDYHFHMIAMQSEAEEVLADNSSDITVRVDANIFARDGGTVAAQRDNNDQDYEIGNRFWMEEYGRMLYAVDVALGPGTEVGSLISASVYDENLNLIGESDFHTVTAQDVNDIGGSQFITLPLFDPVELDGEEATLVCLHAWVSADAIWTGINGTSPAQTSLIYRYDVNDWFYVTTTPMVRMNFAENVGVPETASIVPSLSAAPAVFDERTQVSFTLATSSPIRWDLRDVSGRTMREENLGIAAKDSHTVQVDANDLAEGAYLFTLYTEHGPATLRLVRQARR